MDDTDINSRIPQVKERPTDMFGFDELLTVNKWSQFADGNSTGLFAYAEATMGMTYAVQDILEKCKTYAQLKKELTGFVNERIALGRFIECNL